jgi:dihydrofolate reductase
MSHSLIVAMTRQGVMGRAGGLPWRLSADLKRFKALTMGHHILMGRKTFDSLGRPLPGRTSVVVSRQTSLSLPPGVLLARGVDEALNIVAADGQPFVIGGAQIYSLFLPRIERLYVTWVEGDVAGDTYFPALDWHEWRETTHEPHSADEKNEYDTTFCVYDRLPPSP